MVQYSRDIEKGVVTRGEVVLRWFRAVYRRRAIALTLLAAWLLYCAVVFGRLAWVKTISLPVYAAPFIARDRRLALSQEASRRYAQVVSNAASWETPGLARPWPVGLRNSHDFSLDEIGAMLTHVIDDNAFACLAAVHVGVPVHVIVIGADTLVNPVLLMHGNLVHIVQEESAFHPGEFTQHKRYESVTVGSTNGRMDERVNDFAGMEAVCVQHLLDLM